MTSVDIRDSQRLLTPAEAAELFPPIGETKVAPSTITRWISRGVRGHRLESVRVGRRVGVTVAAVESFMRAMQGTGRDSQAAGA